MLQKWETQVAEASVPDEATIPVLSVGIVALDVDRHRTLMRDDGGRVRDV